MKKISIICTVVFLLCLLAQPLIQYLGGRQGMHLTVPPLFPAEIVPSAIGFLAGLTLVYTAVASLMARRDRKWALGALAVVIGTTGVFWFCVHPATFFLYGLCDRFVAQVGYPTMRQFAAELSQDESLTDADGTLYPPGFHGVASPAEQERWDNLVARYPFLGWNSGSVTISRHGSVQSYWGSALVGHWGFEVALEGTLSVPDKDRGRVLKIANDLHFVSYYD